MSADEHQPNRELVDRFRNLLNQNGHGFHYAIVKAIRDIFERQGRWSFECTEFPTSVRDSETRIDIILRAHTPHPNGFFSQSFYLVCECKRVNPAYSDWCFLKAPFVRRNRSSERVTVETTVCEYGTDQMPSSVTSYGGSLGNTDRGYNIGLEVKNPNLRGDASGGGRNAIEQAAGQVLRGLNGLVNTVPRLRRPHDAASTQFRRTLMPVIFTTANLHVSNVDLSKAEVLSGELDSAYIELQPTPWLFLQYPMSPSLRHEIDGARHVAEFYKLLDAEHIRSIAIVNAAGVEAFFAQFHEYDEPVDELKV